MTSRYGESRKTWRDHGKNQTRAPCGNFSQKYVQPPNKVISYFFWRLFVAKCLVPEDHGHGIPIALPCINADVIAVTLIVKGNKVCGQSWTHVRCSACRHSYDIEPCGNVRPEAIYIELAD